MGDLRGLPPRPTLPELRTRRLRLEPAGVEHLDLFEKLNSDPEVMEFLLGRAATRVETEAEWGQRLGPRTDVRRGLGHWAGWLADGSFAGWWSAAAFLGHPDRVGIGYRLDRAVWGLGLATEGATAMLTHASGVPGVDRVVASTMAVNLRSRRVLENIGMIDVSTTVEHWNDPLPGAELGEVRYERMVGPAQL